MSIVSRIFSSRSSVRINARLAFLMDNLFAIGFGLGLRFVIDNVAHHDLRLTSILVGLWEGVVTLHFLRKMPKSPDPYIGYATRLCVDFLLTENLTRQILVVVWTGLGMILADIAPAIWHDVGGRRKWRRVRRDLYYMTRSIPALPSLPPLFPRARVVRFSPVVQPIEIAESLSTPTATSPAPKADIVPPAPAPTQLRAPKRPIPGGLPSSIVSETDSEATSVLGLRPSASAAGTSHAQFTIRKRATPSDGYGSPAPSSSIDDSNISSGFSSTSTETASQAVAIDEQEEVQARRLDKGKGREMDGDSSGTPTRAHIQLPPTPSDSYRFRPNRSSFVPTITGMPSIPDFFESGLGSDWENIRREEAETEQSVSPPVENEVIPPPVQYEAFYAPSSVYEPTPRPETFDRDLWDEVSNAAPPTPYPADMPPQRPSRPAPQVPMIPRSIPVIPEPAKKEKKPREPAPPPPLPQTPLFGDTWDTEKDQLPPPTPEVFTRTPIYNPGLNLNQGSYTPPVQTASQEPILTHQDVTDPSASFDDPWGDPSQHPEEEVEGQQDTQRTHDQSTVPTTSQTPVKMPSRPHSPTRGPLAPQVQAGEPPVSQQQWSKVSQTPQRKLTPVPPTPPTKPVTVHSTPQQNPSTTLPPPQHKPGYVPRTPLQQPGTVHPTPQQEPVPVPPTTEQQSAPAPPASQQRPESVHPTPRTNPRQTSSTPKQKTSPPPPTPQQKSSPPLPSTPQQASSQIPSAPPQQTTAEVPQNSVAPAPVPPQQQKALNMHRTPKIWSQTVPPSSPYQPNQPMSHTPSQRSRTVPSTPRNVDKPIPPIPLDQDKKEWDDLTKRVEKLDGGSMIENLGDSANQKSQSSKERNSDNLIDLGGGGEAGGENENESPRTEGGGGDNDGGGGEGRLHTPEDDGFVQVDADSNPLSPASSGFSSVAGVPSEIKERNKQAIIIRAQIEEMRKTIEKLKEEKLMALGKEELDPLIEESVLKGQELVRAEKSLDKLLKRAEKRYQAAVVSTGQISLPKNLDLSHASVANATARLEDVLGLYFNSEQKGIVLNINTARGGAGKSMKAGLTKLLEEYGIKPIQKATGVSITLLGRSYTSMVSDFRQKHAKADDDS